MSSSSASHEFPTANPVFHTLYVVLVENLLKIFPYLTVMKGQDDSGNMIDESHYADKDTVGIVLVTSMWPLGQTVGVESGFSLFRSGKEGFFICVREDCAQDQPTPKESFHVYIELGAFDLDDEEDLTVSSNNMWELLSMEVLTRFPGELCHAIMTYLLKEHLAKFHWVPPSPSVVEHAFDVYPQYVPYELVAPEALAEKVDDKRDYSPEMVNWLCDVFERERIERGMPAWDTKNFCIQCWKDPAKALEDYIKNASPLLPLPTEEEAFEAMTNTWFVLASNSSIFAEGLARNRFRDEKLQLALMERTEVIYPQDGEPGEKYSAFPKYIRANFHEVLRNIQMKYPLSQLETRERRRGRGGSRSFVIPSPEMPSEDDS